MNKQLRIGIVGGGQLGRMLSLAAKKLGYSVIVTDPTPKSPAGQVADEQIVADYKDGASIRELGEKCDIITFEIELANDQVLYDLIKKGKTVEPSPQTLNIIRDKLKQKQFLRMNKIPTAAFTEIHSKEDIQKAGKMFGYPMLLKARTDAYDGKGNFVLQSSIDIKKGLEKLKERELYVEQFVPFIKELAVMVARNTKGEIATYPVVQTIHKDNICDVVMAPAPVSKKTVKNAQNLAMQVAKHLKGAGVFGVEMFLQKDDNVLVNEIAPRVHNSGHYTIEGSATSQFEQHIRAITGLPLGSTTLLCRAVVMKNILGERNGPGIPEGLENALKISDASVHIYGKHESRPGRKMGHITVVGNSIEECLKKTEEARKAILI